MQIQPSETEFKKYKEKFDCFPALGRFECPDIDLPLVYESLFYNSPYSFSFESCKGPPAVAQYSLMGRVDGCVLSILQGEAELKKSGIARNIPLELAFELLDFPPNMQSFDYAPHFWGGWVGLLNYEMNELFETLPKRKTRNELMPDACFMEVHRPIVYNHKNKELNIIHIVDTENDASYEEVSEYISETAKCIDSIDKTPLSASKKKQDAYKSELRSNHTQEEYIDKVKRAKKYIEEGDIYQVNLSQEFSATVDISPIDLYKKLKFVNPAPFSGLMKFQDASIISSSPERLVKTDGDRIETRPIAGTRPRGKTEEEDNNLSSELLLNSKEKAEHLMLVDLERNDLGRICETGSVRVTDLMFLEQYSHVNHIVSNIIGKLKPDTSVREIFRAVFPGGTITGCPKVRCMEIINELENSARGPYTGSFGYIGNGGQLDFNIIIRTFVLKNSLASFHVGAGIVADSIPEKEYFETLDKAGALLETLSLSPEQITK